MAAGVILTSLTVAVVVVRGVVNTPNNVNYNTSKRRRKRRQHDSKHEQLIMVAVVILLSSTRDEY